MFTAAFFLLLTVKLVSPALACGVLALVMIIAWLWQTDPGPNHPPVDIGGGIKLPVYVTGPISHSWWAMVMLLLVAGSLFIALVFSYLYIWTVSPQVWPAASGQQLPAYGWPLASAAAFIVSSAAMLFSDWMLTKAEKYRIWPACLGIAIAASRLPRRCVIELQGHWQSGLRPDRQQLWRARLHADRRRGPGCRGRGHHGTLYDRAQRRRQAHAAAARHLRQHHAVLALHGRPGTLEPADRARIPEGCALKESFVRPLLALLCGPLIWFAHFSLVYGAAGFGEAMGIAPGAIRRIAWVATLAAGAAIIFLLVRARMDGAPRNRDNSPALREMTAALAALALLAVLLGAAVLWMIPL